MGKVVSVEGLGHIVAALRDEGRSVIGPVVADGVITHAEIDSIDALPIGWTEVQEAGTYRLEPTGDESLFAWATPASAWKRYLYPPRTLLVRAHRSERGTEVDAPTPSGAPLAFFGIRPCDLAALGVLDRVFLDPDATDPTYAARRDDLFVVTVACGHPGNTCFCVSMDTGPAPRAGYDLAVTELHGDGAHEFVVEAGSERGQALLDAVPGRSADTDDEARAAGVVERAAERMGRELPAPVALRIGHDLDHPRWDDIASRCLACANCTMACPTCFCSTTEDTTDLSGTTAERWRTWDSCFTLDFTHLHGGPVRASTSSRYRQWLLHKLVTWHDQYGSSGCVGCGRCITWCPVGIDLTAEAAALAEEAAP